jgi:hypothetical protein
MLTIRVTDTKGMENLRVHFVRGCFAVAEISDCEIRVEKPDAPTLDQSRREAELYLLV